jgi:hypothetical protein
MTGPYEFNALPKRAQPTAAIHNRTSTATPTDSSIDPTQRLVAWSMHYAKATCPEEGAAVEPNPGAADSIPHACGAE